MCTSNVGLRLPQTFGTAAISPSLSGLDNGQQADMDIMYDCHFICSFEKCADTSRPEHKLEAGMMASVRKGWPQAQLTTCACPFCGGVEILLSFKWHMAKGRFYFYFYNPPYLCYPLLSSSKDSLPREDVTEVVATTNSTKQITRNL